MNDDGDCPTADGERTVLLEWIARDGFDDLARIVEQLMRSG
jgi:hypothetical protein